MARSPIAPHPGIPDAAHDFATALPPDGIAPEMPPLLAAGDDPVAEALTAAAFEGHPDGVRPLLLLDASCDPLIATTLDAFPDPTRCLFDGALGEDLREVAPWLAEPARYGRLWDWYVEEGWGRNWGVILLTAAPLPRMKAHLKKFLMVERDSGARNFFKFYRPAHLNAYLPAFEDPQRARFMRGIHAWIAEGPNRGIAWRHALGEDEALASERIDLGSREGSTTPTSRGVG